MRLIAANPQDWRARLALGRHLAARDRHAEAFEFLLAALEQNPHGLTVHQAVWNVLLKLDLNRALVQRYIESARSSVFFLDPHVCLKCHYRSTDLLWQCPHCHEWNSFVEETDRSRQGSDRGDVDGAAGWILPCRQPTSPQLLDQIVDLRVGLFEGAVVVRSRRSPS